MGRETVTKLVLSVLAVSAALMVWAPTALADDTICGAGTESFAPANPPPTNPVLGPVTVDNVVVPAGNVCTMVGTQVLGSVLVHPQGTLQMWLTDVRGNVTANAPRYADSYSSRIRGSYLNMDATVDTDMCGSRIDGNVHLERTRGNDRIGVGTIVTFCASAQGGGVVGNTIGGNLIVEKALGTTATIRGNTVGGSLQVQKGRNNVIWNNNVRQNLQYFENNLGSIIGNIIGESLQCEDNAPPPTGGGNVAQQKDGQCAAL
jgi:hypothetical protein